jgi:isopropylmalate/homocitrate/citramalate synthase
MGKETMWIHEDGWWTSEVNFLPEIRRTFSIPDKVVIHDATLRDGEQTPGVVFRKEEKLALAKALDSIGVDRIEAGMPAVSDEDMEAVKEIVELKLNAKIMVFSRALPADIDKAVECGVWGIILEVPGGAPRLKYQFNWSIDEVIKRSVDAINYAKEKDLYVSYFPYDGTRAEIPVFKKLLSGVTTKSRPDSVAIVDTTGCVLPEGVKYLMREIKKITDLPIEIHTHNDLGLSVANSLAAVEEGAEVVHACINGLGERCGNTPLEEIVVCLKTLLGVEMGGIRFNKLYEISQLVQELSGIKPAANKSLVGDLTFTRESGLGVDVYKKEPRVAFSVHPAFVGRQFEIVLGKKSGRPSIKTKLEELGIETTDEQLAELLTKVKQKGIEKKGILSDEEFNTILKDTLE